MSEENKYKINLNRPEPSKEKVREYNDFGKLMSDHRDITKRPLYSRRRFYFILVLILIIVYILYRAEKDEEKDQQVPVTIEETYSSSSNDPTNE